MIRNHLLKILQDRGLKSVDFHDDQYIKEEHVKYAIAIHHSAGWDNARGMFDYWAGNKERVATCVGVIDDGSSYQGFLSRYWAYHIGIASAGNKLDNRQRSIMLSSEEYEKHTIGIEVCNWGGLKYRDGKFYTWVNNFGTKGKGVTVPEEKVQKYKDGYRGFEFYEKYTEAEIETLQYYLLLWGEVYSIPVDYDERMWEVNDNALRLVPGIYSHTSFRTDKSDMHPQPELVTMLSRLKSKQIELNLRFYNNE